MATAAEPQPASLPITGGRDQATVRLWPLLCAAPRRPPAWFHRADGRLAGARALGIGVPNDQWIEFPVVAFLAEHPGFGHFLIDTGFHSSVAVDPKQNLGASGHDRLQGHQDGAVAGGHAPAARARHRAAPASSWC